MRAVHLDLSARMHISVAKTIMSLPRRWPCSLHDVDMLWCEDISVLGTKTTMYCARRYCEFVRIVRHERRRRPGCWMSLGYATISTRCTQMTPPLSVAVAAIIGIAFAILSCALHSHVVRPGRCDQDAGRAGHGRRPRWSTRALRRSAARDGHLCRANCGERSRLCVVRAR